MGTSQPRPNSRMSSSADCNALLSCGQGWAQKEREPTHAHTQSGKQQSKVVAVSVRACLAICERKAKHWARARTHSTRKTHADPERTALRVARGVQVRCDLMSGGAAPQATSVVAPESSVSGRKNSCPMSCVPAWCCRAATASAARSRRWSVDTSASTSGNRTDTRQ